MAENAASLNTIPELITKELYLRPLTAEDVERSHHWYLQSNPDGLTCRPQAVQTARQAMEEFKSQQSTYVEQWFMVVRTKDNASIGHIGYFDYNPMNRAAELRIIIDPDERREGYATGAMTILCRYLFRSLGLYKVYSRVASFNEAGTKLFESLQFHRDAALRHHIFHRGEYHDQHIYSRILFEFED